MKATLIDYMGSDLSVINAARVSFGKKSEWEPCVDHWGDGECPNCVSLSKADQGLIQFLARGCTSGDWDELVEQAAAAWDFDEDGYREPLFDDLEDTLNHVRRMPPHWSPFGHTAISLHLKMPIFVARQIMKHTTGMVYNEVSRRYVDDEPEFFVPDVWRKAADNVKQGSSEEPIEHHSVVETEISQVFNADIARIYREMLGAGVAPEQARMVLPQSMYTEVIATGNLYSWANLFIQRTDSHAQQETQNLAHQIGDIIKPLYPVSWEALTQ